LGVLVLHGFVGITSGSLAHYGWSTNIVYIHYRLTVIISLLVTFLRFIFLPWQLLMVYRNGFQPPDAVSHHHGLASEDSDVLARNKAMLTSETPLVFSLSLHDLA
jgi:hypothetical protein